MEVVRQPARGAGGEEEAGISRGREGQGGQAAPECELLTCNSGPIVVAIISTDLCHTHVFLYVYLPHRAS